MSEVALTGAENQVTDTGAENAGDGTGNGSPGGKVFTSKDVEAIVTKRLERERRAREDEMQRKIEEAAEQRLAAWRDENGLDEEALKKLGTEDERKALQRELAQHKGTLTKTQKALDDAMSRYSRVQSHLKNTMGRDAIYKAARTLAVDVEDVWLHLQSRVRVDEEDFTVEIVDEKGELSHGIELEDLVKELLTRKPHLAKPTGVQGAGSSPGTVKTADAGDKHDLLTTAGVKASLRAEMAKMGIS